MIADFILAVLTVAPALRPDEVLQLDALYATVLLGSYMRRQQRSADESARCDDDSDWRDVGGTRKMKINSADVLREVLRSGVTL